MNPRKNTVIVEHANIIKRHTRPNPAKNIKGGIVEKEAPMNVSNVHDRLQQLRQARAHRPQRAARTAAKCASASAAAPRWTSKVLEGMKQA